MAIPLILAASLSAADRAAELDNLYQSNQWFQFRDAMLRGPASAFHRGELALAFRDWPQAEKEFSAAMKPGADPLQAFEAGWGLLQIYDLSGRRKDGRALLSRLELLMQSLKGAHTIDPSAYRGFESIRAQLAALSGYPDQAVTARGRSRLTYGEVANQLIVPLLVEGTPANYIIDTGAEACTVSVAEARRLGLEVHAASVPMEVPYKHDAHATGIAVARDVVIGNFHLRNVSFLVTPEDDTAGTIGLPLLLALETLRWSSDGIMEFGFPPQARNVGDANLCLVGSLLFTRAEIGSRPLVMLFDTGSYGSFLFPRFAQDFPRMIETTAAASTADLQGTTLAEAALRVGGLRTPLRPAPVLSKDVLEDASWAHGWLGMDLLGQARSVTLDLAAMKLTLDGIDGAGGRISAAKACPLPPDFLCAPGWTCTVRAGDDGTCYVDRVPITPWPGNPIDSDTGDDNCCVLSAAASCESGKVRRAVFDSNQSCHITREDAAQKAVETAPANEAPARSIAPAAAAANVRDIVRQSLQYDSLDLAPAKDYMYLEQKDEKTLRADGSVKEATSETREVMNLYDATFERLIRKNGEELSPAKARAEQARFDKAVEKRAHETAEAKAKREEAQRKAAAEGLVCEEEFLKTFDFRLAGAATVNERLAWVVEMNPAPHAAPRCTALKTLDKFRFKVWIDQAEYRWARFEGDNIAPVTFAAVLVRLPTEGLHLVLEQTRHQDGVWLASRIEGKVNAKVLLLVGYRGDFATTYSNYRKFQADSRIVPVGEGK